MPAETILNEDQIEKLCDFLTGKSVSLEAGLKTIGAALFEGDVADDTRKLIDECIFKCENCEVWFSRDDEDEFDDGHCNDCGEEEEYSDEDYEDEDDEF